MENKNKKAPYPSGTRIRSRELTDMIWRSQLANRTKLKKSNSIVCKRLCAFYVLYFSKK